MDTNTSKKTRRIVIGSLLATAALIAVLSDGDDVGQVEVGDSRSDVQFYDGGTITTGENGEVIVSGTAAATPTTGEAERPSRTRAAHRVRSCHHLRSLGAATRGHEFEGATLP